MPDTGIHQETRGRAAARLSPYHADLDIPLLDIGGEPWDIRAACEAVCITGMPGSAKSSSSARQIRMACLRAGMGGLFLAAKTDEAEILRRDITKAGRLDDLVVIDATATERFNILDYAAATMGGQGFEGNLADVMRRMAEAARVAGDSGTSSDGEGKFFVDGAMKWVSHAFPLLRLVEGSIRLADLDRFVNSVPASAEAVPRPKRGEAPHKDHAAFIDGYCAKVLLRADEMARSGEHPGARRISDEHGPFFLREVARLDNRPRSSIIATLTNLIYPFLTGKLNEIFCRNTTITPDACRDGKLIVLDLPVLKYGAMGAVAQSLFKYLFGVAMQSKPVRPDTRPVMLYIDECQNFLSSADADLLAMSRSAKICPVFITQDLPTFFAKMDEESAKSLIGKFGTRIFHANLSYDTNLAASELIGKVQKFHVGETHTTTTSSGGGGSTQDNLGGYQGNTGRTAASGQSSSGYLDYEIPPDHFATKLRTGTQSNNFKADAIVVRGNRNWKRTKRHWIQAEFSQR